MSKKNLFVPLIWFFFFENQAATTTEAMTHFFLIKILMNLTEVITVSEAKIIFFGFIRFYWFGLGNES